MGKVKDITGLKINDWTVIRECGRGKNGSAMFLCRCACGNERVVNGGSIRSGTSKNCGCKRRSKMIEASRRVTTKHGGKAERLYGVWRGMKDRCNNPKSRFYSRYGGRGIKVCEEWDRSYAEFREWALSNGYVPNLPKYKCTIERINNNEGYNPDNCIWTSQKAQCNNRNSCHIVEFNGVAHTLSEWAELTGIRKDTLRRRLCVYEWSVERTLTEPVRKHGAS